MNVFEFVLIIVLMGLICKLIQTGLEHRHARKEREAYGPNDELLDRLERIEERVQVLERIVTDDRADLKRQFRDLAN